MRFNKFFIIFLFLIAPAVCFGSQTVRQVTPTGVLKTSATGVTRNYDHEYHLFTRHGQSNSMGRGYAEDSPTAVGIEIEDDDTIKYTIADPLGTDSGSWQEAITGCAGPSFAKKYYELTGRKVALFNASKGGTCVSDWNSSLYSEAHLDIDAALSALTTAGIDYTYMGVIWFQGECETVCITGETCTKANYITWTETLIASFKSDFPQETYPNFRFHIVQIGICTTNGYASGAAEVRAAQEEICNDDADVYLAYENPYTTMLNVHYDHLNDDMDDHSEGNTQYNAIGEGIAETLAAER